MKKNKCPFEKGDEIKGKWSGNRYIVLEVMPNGNAYVIDVPDPKKHEIVYDDLIRSFEKSG